MSSRLAQLRHQLRTPLNHILGYTEILLEDQGLNAGQDTGHPLASIHALARQVLEHVQQALSPAFGEATENDLDKLRARIERPLQSIARSVGELARQADPAHLLDLLRINSAASELLAFAHGQAPKSAAAPKVKAAGQAASPLTANVLLVDDDESNRDMLSRQLERAGCKVTCAEDGSEALRLLDSNPYDAVLLDVIMPGVDGVAVLERIGSRPEMPPVIMISALDEMDSVRRCLDLGAEDYLLKPFDPVLLRSRLTATLDRSRLRARERERTRALEHALQRLRSVNENLQQFAFAASHDLKSPIRTVTLMAQLLARRYKDQLDKEANDLIDSITSSMGRMNDLVADLLAYSQLDTHSPESMVEFPLDEPLDAALANLEESIRSSGATVERETLPAVTGMKGHFVQLFQNLIENSLKYRSGEPPRIRIASELRHEECIIRVTDNGIGFQPDYASRIFEPFRRLHGQEYPGSGIGLGICSKIVSHYGGRIWAESEPGRGSVFSFSIPAAACHEEKRRDACISAS